ncbi:hypothetical protein A2773_05320 [Candidatus Gottesmanbacteria bacterium RIFCSPHIGHO2_01_FULL_39_10]|uniref:Uncharacterized protein n=1 Tax=Candidatus Gottesmanbacteria bacterium RIFCSPHIGHO2_01_FULL_39_10 TaxID=1798375 RepID=A0A1F5ZNZ6_9BACT|nr:MAG: hypothetical protein A2773_05320 [Candidatus Gottesmanbacteria bacterium RIFCSPHIGHO2_01_FULL_39_10]
MERKITDYKAQEGEQYTLNDNNLDPYLEEVPDFNDQFKPTAKVFSYSRNGKGEGGQSEEALAKGE